MPKFNYYSYWRTIMCFLGLELFPILTLGLMNGWILLIIFFIAELVLVLSFPKGTRGRLFEHYDVKIVTPRSLRIHTTPVKHRRFCFVDGIVVISTLLECRGYFLYKYNAYWFLRWVAVTIESELRTIEQRLDKEGDTKEIRKAFWRIVGKIKRLEPTDVRDEIIEKTAHIRNRLFKHNILLSVNRGLGLFFLITLFAFIGFIWAILFFETILALFIILPPLFTLLALNGILLVLMIFLAYGAYPWGRYIGGIIARVKFDGFYRYSPGELGLKIEYTSYLKTTQSRRKWVFGVPVIWIFGLFLLLTPIAMVFNPTGIWTPLLMVLLFGVFYIAIYYRKTGELYRFVRELRIDRELKRK